MFLTKMDVEINVTNTKIDLEKIDTDLVMINIINNINDQSLVFSYWRIKGSSNNPPLEIGINTKTNTIKSITIFIDSDCFYEFDLPRLDCKNGNIIIKTDNFKKENDYIDVEGTYNVSLLKNKLICIFDLQIKLSEVILNDCIEFFIDDSDKLCGFAINNLSEQEIDIIHSLIKS